MASTYTPIATNTVANSTTASVTFSSISGSYTDLVLVSNGGAVGGFNGLITFNSDSGANYGWNRLLGTGSSASCDRNLSANSINFLVYDYPTHTVNVQNYSNTSVQKSVMVRFNNPSNYLGAVSGIWRSTAAITSVTIATPGGGAYFPSGMTFNLYGITAA